MILSTQQSNANKTDAVHAYWLQMGSPWWCGNARGGVGRDGDRGKHEPKMNNPSLVNSGRKNTSKQYIN